MEKFCKLAIKVDSQQTVEFLAALDTALTEGWSRALDIEGRAKEDGDDSMIAAYRCDKRSAREAAWLSILRSDAETLIVRHLVPSGLPQLDTNQCNTILRDFSDKVLSELHDSFPVQLSSDQLRIEAMMTKEVFSLLRQFSVGANKGTGSGHPMDSDRWYAFLVALHRSHHHLNRDSLFRWLNEVEQWPDEIAIRLADEFEFAMGLLDKARSTPYAEPPPR